MLNDTHSFWLYSGEVKHQVYKLILQVSKCFWLRYSQRHNHGPEKIVPAGQHVCFEGQQAAFGIVQQPSPDTENAVAREMCPLPSAQCKDFCKMHVIPGMGWTA